MRVVKSLGTNGYVFFGKASLDLDYKGVTVIQALNLDARKGQNATNGAGKSLFVGLLPEIFYDSVPTGKDLKAQSLSRAGYAEIQVGQDVYRLDRTWGKKKSFQISKNGNDLNVRTLAFAAERASKIIGLTEEEFYSTAYIDVNRPHPLVRGSSTERVSYFTSLFRLHDTDNLRKLLLQELREAETASVTYKELVANYKDIRGQTSVEQIRKLESKRDKLKTEADEFVEVSARYREIQQILEFRDQYQNLIDKVAKECSPHEIEDTLKAKRKQRSSLRAQVDQIVEYEAQQKAIDEAKARVDKKLMQLRTFGLPTDPVKAKKGHRLFKKTEPKLVALDKERERIQTERNTVKAQLEEICSESGEYLNDLRQLELPDDDKRKKTERKEAQLEHELEHSRKFGEGQCPTCGHKVEARPVKEIRAELTEVQARLLRWTRASDVRTLDEKEKKLKKELDQVVEDANDLRKKVNKYERYSKAHETLSNLPEIPEKTIEKPRGSRADLETEIERNDKAIATLERASSVVDMIVASSKLTDKQIKSAKALKERMVELSDSASKLAVLEARIESENEKLRSLRKMRDKALTLKDRAKDVPIIKSLLEVYSNKGLKKLMIQRYAAVIQEQLNKFRSVLFSEDFTFELIYDSKFHILCHRRYGKRVVTSDVRKLSGAEGRAFTLLLLLATLTLIPKQRRLNLLILDEADSNMGPDMFQNFLRFIPILNKVIPHIVIVTPKNDVQYEGARVFTAIKQGGKSRLVKGQKLNAT